MHGLGRQVVLSAWRAEADLFVALGPETPATSDIPEVDQIRRSRACRKSGEAWDLVVRNSRQRNSPHIVRRWSTSPQPGTAFPPEKRRWGDTLQRHCDQTGEESWQLLAQCRNERAHAESAFVTQNSHPSAGSSQAHDGGRIDDCERHLLATLEFTTVVRAKIRGSGRSPEQAKEAVIRCEFTISFASMHEPHAASEATSN